MDVLAVLIAVPHTVRVFARNEAIDDAEAIVKMAVARRGVDIEFYVITNDGEYQEGEKWVGHKAPPVLEHQ